MKSKFAIIMILLNFSLVLNVGANLDDINSDLSSENSTININQDIEQPSDQEESTLELLDFQNDYLKRVEEYEKYMKLYEESISTKKNNSENDNEFLMTTGIGDIDTNYADDKAYQVFKEGTYFPQLAVAKIDFKVALVGSINNYLTLSITQDQDTYARIVRVKVNGLEKYSGTIYGGTTILYVNTGFWTSTRILPVSIEIEWGAWKQYGWKLNYAYAEPMNDHYTPLQMWFPQTSVSKIDTYFIGGSSSWVQLQINRDQDTYGRYLDVLVDGNLIWNDYLLTSTNSMTLSLGNYQDRTIHRLTLSIEWGGHKEHGWTLDSMKVYWLATTIEVDWMQGYEPSTNDLNYIQDYYLNNGYEQITFIKSEQIPTDNNLNSSELEDIYDLYSDRVTLNPPTGYRYMVAGKYAETSGVGGFALAVFHSTYVEFLDMFFIAYQAFHDAWWLGGGKFKTGIMHELGHTFTILLIDSGTYAEYYDWSSSRSCMSVASWDNTGNNPYYSNWWWTNNWWNLREQMNTRYPTHATKANSLIFI